MREGRALDLIMHEYRQAKLSYPPMQSYHEGYATLLEEVDELWDAIKTKGTPQEEIRDEAKQVGAMALRILIDLCEE